MILALTSLFFSVQLLQWLASLATCCGRLGEVFKATASSAGVCVGLCPLLGILFVGCRMRALQLTNQQGSPHWWAQDSMRLSVMAIFLQVACCVLLPLFTGAATSVDGDGSAEYNL